MKMNLLKKLSFVTAFLMSFIGQAQLTLQDINSKVSSEKAGAFGLINTIISIIMFGGLIYVIVALIGKRDDSKTVLIGWVVALVVWGIGNALLA